ncbi:hypothetical protein SAMN05428985_103324 [Nocardioides sp. YR527]|uniref:hypothetical protein n=1 Tax=Nocardioides sp. YR527 TaxID=1881028 RepID=UPI00088A7CFA|nr:hypothetical protein [Nocardioides sp. YR527]SDK26945.1 hypothetical protein SAMN05428985_103324 [Nocardioides sp. YR527]
MNAIATGGGVVKGPMMVILKEYVATANPEEVRARLKDWIQARQVMLDASRDLELASGKLPEAFEETSFTTEAATRAFRTASEKLNTKVNQLNAAIEALTSAQNTTQRAQDAHKQLEASLPANHGPAPDSSSPQYAQSGPGVDTAQAARNQKALQDDRAAHAAREQAIADAERAAAEEIKQIDRANYTAEPPVREITDEPNTESSSKPVSPSSPGSYSEVAASRARMTQYNSGTLYPGGMGHDLIAQEKANIEAHLAENKPELRDGQWINADGTPAPSTSYAMVETADGLAPMAGGSGGMAALAIAGGGALLSAGVAKALASKFSSGASAKAATASATSRSAAARAGAAGARAGAGAGAGARGAGVRGAGAGAGARGAGGRGGRGGPTGAGSRAGRGGAGGAGGRGGKKDDKRNGQDQDWQADYSDDWTETASDVLDPNASRGWTPNTPQDDASSADKNGRKPS